MRKKELITREVADKLYEEFKHNCESQMFFEALIDNNADHVSLTWHGGEITVTVLIDDEYIDYKFEPYDVY